MHSLVLYCVVSGKGAWDCPFPEVAIFRLPTPSPRFHMLRRKSWSAEDWAASQLEKHETRTPGDRRIPSTLPTRLEDDKPGQLPPTEWHLQQAQSKREAEQRRAHQPWAVDKERKALLADLGPGATVSSLTSSIEKLVQEGRLPMPEPSVAFRDSGCWPSTAELPSLHQSRSLTSSMSRRTPRPKDTADPNAPPPGRRTFQPARQEASIPGARDVAWDRQFFKEHAIL